MTVHYNKWIGTGRLTRDVELRKTDEGTAVANFGIAINNRSKRGDEWIDQPAFIDVAIFGERGEAFAGRYKKGDKCFLEAHIRMDQWEDRNTGEKRTKIKMVADKVIPIFEDKPKAASGTADDTPF